MLSEAQKHTLEIYSASIVRMGKGQDFIDDKIRSAYIFYTNTSKTTKELKVYPLTFQNENVNLEEEEKAFDKFLFEHFSVPLNPKHHWPRIHTTIDPKVDQVYKILEFPVLIGQDRVLSIKQSVGQGGKLIALSYRLAEL